MKKSILFASVIALVAILAASCKPKVDAPKALFSYEVDGLTVTFTNLSKDADSYVWEFGDNATDTAASPKHTYAAFGDYSVKLTAKNAGGSNVHTELVTLEKKALAIDGNFSDWTAPGIKVAECVADAKAKDEYLYAAKFARDDEFIYFYLEFNGEKDDFIRKIYNDDWTEVIGTEPVSGYYAENFDFYLNCGDDLTGGNSSWLWEEAAADICVEGTWIDKFEGATIHTWPEDQYLKDDWLWEQTTVMGAVSCCEAVTLENKHLAVEGKITIGMLPVMPTESLKMGVLMQSPAWEQTGILPQITVNTDGTETIGRLIEVPKL